MWDPRGPIKVQARSLLMARKRDSLVQQEKSAGFPAVLGIVSVGGTKHSREQEAEALDPVIPKASLIMAAIHPFPCCA